MVTVKNKRTDFDEHCFIITELSSNGNGDFKFKLPQKKIQSAIAGADAVKL